jgi:Cof subfamily protein (haloacid dehalogenase superfamily)
MPTQNPERINARDLRLAAIDLDGTLLAPDLSISAENHRAVDRLHAAGLEVVIASGRHYLSIRRFAALLPSVQWIVSVQGAEVCDVARTQVLAQSFLAPEKVAAVVAAQKDYAVTATFYTAEGVLTTGTSEADQVFYRKLTGLNPAYVSAAELAQHSIYKIVWVGTPTVIDDVTAHVPRATPDVQTVRTHLELYEFMPVEVSKATGLAALTQRLGFTASQVVAFGDADNDISMFDWAGESFVMAHGWPVAKARARHIAPEGPRESALARAVAMIELG